MEIIKTKTQLLVEYRNEIAKRCVSYEVSAVAWDIKSKKAKRDTQERVDAINQKAANEVNAAKDREFLKVIDKVISETK